MLKCNKCSGASRIKREYHCEINGWICRCCANGRRRCKHSERGCQFIDVDSKCSKHEAMSCQYMLTPWCMICKSRAAPDFNEHYTNVHADITRHNGSMFEIKIHQDFSWYIVKGNFGQALCEYKWDGSYLEMYVRTTLPTVELTKYELKVTFKHRNEEHTITCLPQQETWWDWKFKIPLQEIFPNITDEMFNTKLDFQNVNF